MEGQVINSAQALGKAIPRCKAKLPKNPYKRKQVVRQLAAIENRGRT